MAKAKKDWSYITDDYIRSQNTVKTDEAAVYLGVSWWVLTGELQDGKAPYGIARLGKGGRWIYTIWGERLYRYKRGLDIEPEAVMLGKKLDALTAEVADYNERTREDGAA